ncbi:MAG TPA: hypothetical protein VK714_20510 [Myxococcota bacterium]|nr:hypothetical protein [Myxococcota bacterium]
MGLYLGQRCETRLVDGEHQVATLSYQYKLYASGTFTPGDEREALLRWEYLKHWPTDEDRWCRHHVQGPVNLGLGDGVLLKDLHLPTGYVVIEDVIRFCVADLGVHPLSDGWHDHLMESYELFRKESTPPR